MLKQKIPGQKSEDFQNVSLLMSLLEVFGDADRLEAVY